MNVRIASSEQEFRKISPVLRQLRSQYTDTELIAQIQLQIAQGYRIAYVEIAPSLSRFEDDRITFRDYEYQREKTIHRSGVGASFHQTRQLEQRVRENGYDIHILRRLRPAQK